MEVRDLFESMDYGAAPESPGPARRWLEEREGTLSDMLAAERALADVQGEIDSMTASLEAAKKRVAMSIVNCCWKRAYARKA